MMKSRILTALFLTHTAHAQAAQYTRLLLPQGEILPREFGDGICVQGSTCDECFGDGYIICDKIGCFNPDEHQQCCKNAFQCTSKSDDCCDELGGTGVIGSSGAPVAPTAQPTSTGEGWYCTADEDPEDCCQKGGKETHWCGGEFLNARCFNAKLQQCCTDGTVCDDSDCCENLFSLSTTKPWLAEETEESKTISTDVDEAASTTAESAPASSTSDDAASLLKIDGGLVTIGLSILGFILF